MPDYSLLKNPFYVTECTMQRITVIGYIDEFEKPNLHNGHGDTAYDSLRHNQTILIGIRNAIIVGEMIKRIPCCVLIK